MAVLLRADGSKEEILPKDGKVFTLEEQQEHVGGYVQHIQSYTCVLVINEDGKAMKLPRNHLASELYNFLLRPKDYFVGSVLEATYEETGYEKPNGGEEDV